MAAAATAAAKAIFYFFHISKTVWLKGKDLSLGEERKERRKEKGRKKEGRKLEIGWRSVCLSVCPSVCLFE